MARATEWAVEFSGVSKVFDDVPRVDGLNWQVAPGRVYGLLGPNGAGKSTVINLITGLLAPTSGSVLVGGSDPVRDAMEVRRMIGLVPQHDTLYPDLTGRENLEFHGALYMDSMKEVPRRIAEILELVELADRAGDRVSPPRHASPSTRTSGARKSICRTGFGHRRHT